MKAIAVKTGDQLEELDLPLPELFELDLLIEVKAIGLNPVDTKVRKQQHSPAQPKILGWDASGIVKAIGKKVSRFSIGDEVYYSGDIHRQGCNAEYQVVDERLVALKPSLLSFTEAAALPLTSLTAYEGLYNHLALNSQSSHEFLLVIGGAGGVGSMVIQLARLIPSLKIVASASRPSSQKACIESGADEVIDHPLKISNPQLISRFNYIFCTQSTDIYFYPMTNLIAPFGKIVCIVESTLPFNLEVLKNKSASFAWEFMFTRSLYQIEMEKQGEILSKVAHLVDRRSIRVPPIQILTGFNIENVIQGHQLLETGKTIGKIVIEMG
ncbi:MAG: hypothetical protein BGO14_02715 [Chlamydiales bacterium 38-26]|nr:zinc-binding alcohol dehydrogenase family protein [Chlamydiales bacterium]OJV09263.1 MAG: hypothetical protein BGO14_02715 [Chlamydiales bacterium 38-26]